MNEYMTLCNGVKIPMVGFGTDMTFIYIRKNVLKGVKDFIVDIIKKGGYHFRRDCSIFSIVKNGPDKGCHLFDTASAYGQSERVLGFSLKKYSRDDYFIITKLSNKEQRDGDVEKALRRILKKLKVDYVDLYLMHWPQTGTYFDSWKQMEDIYRKGLARAIGVCNFKEHHFKELAKVSQIAPMVCQVESHPLFPQNDILRYCQKNNIQMMAYTPTGRMDERIKNSPVLKKIAACHDKTIAQVIIRWHIQRKVIPIINTTNIEHLNDNMNVFDFVLTEEEMKEISSLNCNCRLRYDPDTVDFTKC